MSESHSDTEFLTFREIDAIFTGDVAQIATDFDRLARADGDGESGYGESGGESGYENNGRREDRSDDDGDGDGDGDVGRREARNDDDGSASGDSGNVAAPSADLEMLLVALG